MIKEEYRNQDLPVIVDYMKKKYVSPSDTNRLHYHPYHEIVVIDKGFVTYAADSGIIRVAEKSMVFMPAHTLHNPFVQNSHPYERYKVGFSSDFANGIFVQPHLLDDALKSPYIKRLKQTDYDEIHRIVKALYKISENSEKSSLDKLNECVHLTELILKGYSAVPLQSIPHESYITDVIGYIKQNFNKTITIQLLADRFFVSRSKLVYDFKNYCRVSILEYITITRIEAGKKYLLDGWSVARVSDACGFSTVSYFIKVFSKITGLTPLKFQMKYLPEGK